MAQPARAKEKNESIRQRGNGQKLAIKHHNGGATTISTGRFNACRSFLGVERRRLYKRCTRRGRPRGSPIPDAVNTSALAKHTVISYSLVYETHHAIATD